MTQYADDLLTEKYADDVAVTIYVECKNQDGKDFYVFLNTNKKGFEKLTYDITIPSGAPLNITEYGKVVFCSMGKANDDVKTSIAAMFGYDLSESIIVAEPATFYLAQPDADA